MKKLKNYSEEQALAIIDKVVGQLSKQFKFGYYDVDDLKQEGTILALDVINDGRYDEDRPLENFLRVYIKSRFINLKRNKYFRTAMPCHACPLYDELCKKTTNQCMGFTDKMECDKYNTWFTLNHTKKNLVDCVNIGDIDDENERGMKENFEVEEKFETEQLKDYIDEHLPAEMRADYLKMITNFGAKPSHQAKLTKQRQELIRHTVQELIKEFYGRQSSE